MRAAPRVVDAYASLPQYVDHIAPVCSALTDNIGVRTTLWVPRTLLERAHAAGVDARAGRPRWSPTPALVASHRDAASLGHRPLVLMEHGSGQRYAGNRNPGYAGGRDRVRDRVVLFLCPGEVAARANRATYPDRPVVTVGCPRLDRWLPNPPAPDPATVAIAFHWDARAVAPEAGTAWAHYASSLQRLREQLADRGVTLVGHGHPRAMRIYAREYERACIPIVDDVTVLTRAAVLAVDNSSLAWEGAALGRRLVMLNAPQYRRDVEHGLRFWEHAGAGVNVNEPDGLLDAFGLALAEPPEVRRLREAAVADVYEVRDGTSARRAAEAISGILDTYDHDEWSRRFKVGNPKAPRRRNQPTELLGVVDPPVPEPEVEDPPAGTIAELLAWVGDDRERAQRALDAELAREKPRVVAVTNLRRRLR